jgi:hypothetical protein
MDETESGNLPHWQYEAASPAGWLRGLAGVIRVPVTTTAGPPADEGDDDG